MLLKSKGKIKLKKTKKIIRSLSISTYLCGSQHGKIACLSKGNTHNHKHRLKTKKQLRETN